MAIFEKRIRHLQRYREITLAFSRNGFGYLVTELGLDDILSLPKRLFVKPKEKVHTKTIGERIRLFLEDLGPTFVKIGQIASTRPDFISRDIIQELEKLQDMVAPFPYQDVKKIIEQELEFKMEDLYKEFHEESLGSASIGQVHYGVLKTGEKVAVKIQRPDIEKTIKTDLEILRHLAILAELRIEWAAKYQITKVVEEFAKVLLAELDYTIEGRNADKIAKQFKDNPNIIIPMIHWELTKKKVLTMEFIPGTKISELEEIEQKGYNNRVLAERITQSLLQQILIEGFFHGDPHPGNILALPKDAIAYMDFGMVGRLSPEMKASLSLLVIALMRQNSDGVIKAIMKMGIVPDDIDMPVLRAAIDELREKYYDVPLSRVSLGEAVNDLFNIAHYHQIQLPTELTILAKTLLTMEGVVEKLDPELSVLNIAEPFGMQLLMEQYDPKRVAENMFNQFQELTAGIKKGKVPIEISVPKTEELLNKLERVSNRLSLSIVLHSFSLLMVGLIIGSALGEQSIFSYDIPAVEIGFVVAILIFVWLVFSVFKSGR